MSEDEKSPEELMQSDEVDEPNVDDEQAKNATETNDRKDSRISRTQDLTPYFEKSDPSINKIHCTEVPQICRDEPCQLGVDEAGRGPVLGPMVYGIAYAPLSKKQSLVDIGCVDSKILTEDQRDGIFDKICDKHDEMGWAIEAISPNVIANSMYRRSKESLNEVSMNSAIGLINLALEAGVHVTEIYVDTVGKPKKYQAKLKAIFPEIEKIVVAKKADSTYPIVSAASICAKVSRDHALRAWQFSEGDVSGEYGSGYPNDPVTKKWLTENVDQVFGFPRIVRFHWSTAEQILESKALGVEWEDVEDAEASTQPKISNFVTRTSPGSNKSKRRKHSFFAERFITNTTEL